MRKVKLGAQGPDVSVIGLGCMSFAGFFGPTDEATSHHCLDAAVDHGINFLDTANVYGPHISEKTLGNWGNPSKSNMFIATKAGITRKPENPVDNSESYLRAELEGSLRRLGVDHVTLFYAHRHDPSMPIEELAGIFGKLIDEGKISGYGLSEVAPTTLRRAHAERACMAVQSEYSAWSRLPELGMIQATAELGVAFVPFSPLARGMLGEKPLDPTTFAPTDFRATIPRFSADNFPRNIAAFEPFKAYARDQGWSVAAASLAWVLDKGDHLIPIPGSRTAAHLAEWIQAADIKFSPDQRREIDQLLPSGMAYGDRYSMAQLQSIERYC